ncbi:dopamine beta-hydroxylase [Labeo rohita]|uniref:Dopamine beta-hydroxylase n=1 Tax=Labeo rohita TaxID=84645 RepID=A0A498LIR1_LABRO|nr:dopamine beta-hydroxylase [Labeo rohita]RXN21366.1 dopamine beta-hydroxylase [Labeo rohita]
MRLLNKDLRLQDVTLMYLTVLATVVVLLVASYQAPAVHSRPTLAYHILLDPLGQLELSWNISYPTQEVYLELKVKELHHGILLGMSDRGEPTNADLVLLWDDGRKSYFGDAWSDNEGRVMLDTQQDYQLLETHQSTEGFFLLFKRPFSTCDPHDYIIEEGTVHIIYATLERPILSLHELNISSLQPGIQRVLLLRPDTPSPALPRDVRTLEVLAPDVIIPTQETTYWCHIYQLPPNMPKNHIVMYESVITPGNEAIVHHIEVFECSPQMDTVPQFSGSCDSKMKPRKLNYCRHVLAAWAMGAEALPAGGIHIFASQLHTHLAGLGVRTVLVRGGREVEVVQEDKHFSTHYQIIRVLRKMVTVLPGDALLTKCKYNTEDRNKVTVGGFGIMEEMCVNYVHYYPRTQLELCKSHVDTDYLQKYFSLINRFQGRESCSCPGTTVEEQFSSLTWDSFSGEVLNSLYLSSPISMHCNQSTAVLFPGEWEKQEIPLVTAELQRAPYPCELSRRASSQNDNPTEVRPDSNV